MYKLRLINDDESEIIDLLHGPVRLHDWGWAPKFTSLSQRGVNLPFGYQTTSVGYGAVTETFSVIVEGCADEIRDRVAEVERFLEGAAAHMDDPLVENAHWLEWSAGGEDPKRSLVTGGAISPLSGVGYWPMLSDLQLRMTLVVTRHPLWENAIAATPAITVDSASSVGGTIPFLATPGRVPARIAHMMIRDDGGGIYGGADAAITKIWMGFRPEYEGLTNFVPVWECESTAIAGGHSTIIDVADTANTAYSATYHNGYGVTTTFTDTVMEPRISIALHDVAGNVVADYPDFVGRYLILARCWVSDDSAVIQMRYGYDETTARIACDPIVVDHAAPLYVELGTVQIPTPGLWPFRFPVSASDQIGAFTIWLYSQNVAATSMTIDALVLIPADYFVKLEDAVVLYNAAPAVEDVTVLSTLPDDRVFAVAGQYDGNIRASVAASPNQWYAPIGNSLLVVAAEQAALQDINDDLDLAIDWYPRWQSYRD